MKYKIVKLVAVFLASFGFTGLQAQSSLYVKTKDGTQTSFVVSNIHKLTFPTGSVVVTNKTGNPQSYALSTVRYLSFADYKTEAPLVKTQEGSSLTLYPNPASNELNISYLATQGGTMRLRIIDLQGQTVLEQTQQSTVGENKTRLDISPLPAGLYLLSNGIESTEFIKIIK